jgi:class 3 adenylate cyclase/predicted esterase
VTETARSRLLTLVFTDLLESTGLKARLGDHAAGAVVARHHDLVRTLAGAHGGREVDSAGDGFFLTFETPSAAAAFALELQAAHRAEADLPAVRIGIHLGEVTERAAPPGSSKPLLVEGLAVDLAARIQSLARPGQVLLSRAAFDAARQRLRAEDLRIETSWRAHGPYLFKGIDEPVEIGEAGIAGVSPLEAPPDSEKARRAVAAGDELTLGWRPAIGLLIPGREHWRLVEQLGSGAIGEVWLAAHDKTRARRVFKFCFEAVRLRGLKREVVLLRLLRERLGERRDIAQVLDWEFERPPFFLETAYTEAGDLLEWSNRKGGIAAVPLTDRIEIAAQAAEALAAAHEAGILHKDLKPSNLLISESDPGGGPRVCLTDFGIGLVTSRDALSSAGVTVAGMTETLLSSSSSTTGAGTRLYMAPEVVEGRPATERSDIYGLGVVLYQMAIGDFTRALAPGWERAVADDVLREDIAAAVDGDATRRLASARELATRLRSLERRRTERHELERGRLAAETSGRRRRILMIASASALLLAVVGTFFVRQQRALSAERARAEQVRWAREEALPEIARLAAGGDFVSAFALAERAQAVIPNDPVLTELWSEISAIGTLQTRPEGARISVQPYASEADGEWKLLGESPIAGVRLPRGVYRWRIEKEGFDPVDLVRRPPDDAATTVEPLLVPFDVELMPAGTTPAGMVRVAGGTDRVWLAGFDNVPPVELEPFYIDRFEVTNREFREFVASGGYLDREYWPDIPDAQARAGFVDRTGRPGPATWELGTYPDGEDDLPVRGMSWYEADAYCRFRGRSLPTAFHWSRAAFARGELLNPITDAIIPASNLAGDAPAPVGRQRAMASSGAYDMAGNVREWAVNANSDGHRYLLGGAWNEPGYLFTEPHAEPASTRESNVGIRCMALEGGGPIPERLAAPLGRTRSDPRKLEPVSDEVFATFLARGFYTPGPLDATVEARDGSHEHWVVETVSFTAAYGAERVPAYLVLPKNASPPFQAVIYAPPGSAFVQPSRDDLRQAVNLYMRHVLRSGRAMLYPVLAGTYDRRPEAPDPELGTKQLYDVNRSLDYLESRPDIDAQRIGYVGFSFGAALGGYLVRPGSERLKALVLVASGLPLTTPPPHRDAVNFAPRVKIPVLMINGRYDSGHPAETTIEPLYRLFGAPENDKKLVLYDSGHVPQPALLWIKEALDWLDRYLGPVDGAASPPVDP